MADFEDATHPGYVEPEVRDKQEEPARTFGTPAEQGELLTLDGKALARYAHRLWSSQDDRWARRLAEYTLNERRRNGEKGIWIRKQENIGSFEVWAAPGMNRAPIPVYNKADRDCQRLTSQLFADPYLPEVAPSTDTDDNKQAAELSQRILEDADSEGCLNDVDNQMRALDLAHTGGSGYILYYIDPYAGGRHPVEVEAGKEALDFNTATKNPLTQEPWSSLTTRYVREDGTLTDRPEDAAQDWWPRIDASVYHARHVRFLPWDAANVWDADGVMIAEYRPIRELRRMYGSVFEGMDDAAMRALAKERPEKWDQFLPQRNGKAWDPGQDAKVQTDDLLCAHLRIILTESADYPDGAYVCVLGKSTVARQDPWVGKDRAGRFKLDLPVTQTRLWRKAGDPHGWGTMDAIGDASEARAAIMGMFFDYLDQVGNLKWFLPQHSTLSGKEWLLQTNLPFLYVNPGGEPRRQELPPLPGEVVESFQMISSEIDETTRLSDTARGLETPNAQSGRAKLAVISQVHAGLSEIRQNIINAHIRAWRIKLQLIRQGYTRPQQLSYAAEDGTTRLVKWRGSDLSGVKDVTIRPGTGTMLPPLQKIEQALSFQQAGLYQKEDILDVVGSQLSAVVGMRDNPHLQRVRREISQWEQGPKPTDDGQPPMMPRKPVMQPMTGPMGEPMMGPVMGPDGQPQQEPMPHPEAVAIFKPRPVDGTPYVAAIRERELGRAMASLKYQQFDPSWQLPLDMAYEAALKALQPPPPVAQGNPNQPPPSNLPPNPATPPAPEGPEIGMIQS